MYCCSRELIFNLVAGVLASNDSLLIDGSHHSDLSKEKTKLNNVINNKAQSTYNNSIVLLAELLADLIAELTLRQAKVIASVTLVVHQRNELIIYVEQLC